MRVGKPPRLPTKGFAAFVVTPVPAVRLSQRVELPFDRTPISKGLHFQLGVIRPRIMSAMPLRGGILLRVAIHESKAADEYGKADQRFVGVDIVGLGPEPALTASMAIPRLSAIKRAPRGWKSRSLFIWVTR